MLDAVEEVERLLDRFEEGRGLATHLPGAGGALLGSMDHQLLLGPGDRHIEQAGLLGQLGLGFGEVDRDQPLLHTGQVNHRPLEAFGGVEGGQFHRIGVGATGVGQAGAQPGAKPVGGAGRVEVEVLTA